MKCSWILLPRESLLKPSNIFPDHFLRIYPYISKNVIILCILGGIFFLRIFVFLMGASLVAQMVKNLPVMQETSVRSLGQEDPLEKGMPFFF